MSGSHPFGGRSPREALKAGLAPAPAPRIDARQLDALRRALALRREQRTVSVAEFLAELGVRGHETLHALRETTRSAAPSDLPIIGNHSAAGEASDSGTRLPQWVEYQRAAARATDSPWRIDPADIHRHAHLVTLNESRKTSLGIWVALVAALGVAASWNYEELRSFVGNSIANADTLTADFAQNGAPAPLEATSGAAEVDAPAVAAKPHESAELAQTPPVVARPVAAPSASEPAAPEKTVAVAAADRAAAETFAFATSVVTVSEARAGASVRIRRRGETPGETSIVWWTSDGSAFASEDYADLGTTVEKFAAGEETLTINIPIVGDSKSEGRESFYVNLAKREERGDLAQPATNRNRPHRRRLKPIIVTPPGTP